jgi:predicted transcriptional regulator
MEKYRPHLYLEGTVEDVMSKPPIVVNEDDDLANLVEMFKQHCCHGFPVVDRRGVLVGIARDTDVISIFARKEPAALTYDTIKDITYTPPLMIEAKETIQKAILKMFADQTRLLVVVDKGRNVVGVVTRTDLIKGIHWKK